MNITGLDFITLLVSDLEASYRSYKEKVGLNESCEKRPNAYAFTTKTVWLSNTPLIRQAENREPRSRNHRVAAMFRRDRLICGDEEAGRFYCGRTSAEPLRYDILIQRP
jgi:hypothetical protein